MDLFIGAHPFQLIFLKDPEELWLGKERHFPDLIQKQGSALGHLDLSDLSALFRSGEGALLIAKQLALKQIVRDAGAVDGHKGVFAPAALFVDGSGDQLLSSAGLPGDQHRSGTVGDPPDHPLDLGNGRAGADDPLKIAGVLGKRPELVGDPDIETGDLAVDLYGSGGDLGGHAADGHTLFKQVVALHDPLYDGIGEDLPKGCGGQFADL